MDGSGGACQKQAVPLTSRMLPPWSAPMPRSTSPVATRTPVPELEPPAERVLLYGFPTGPCAAVLDTPKEQTTRRP